MAKERSRSVCDLWLQESGKDDSMNYGTHEVDSDAGHRATVMEERVMVA